MGWTYQVAHGRTPLQVVKDDHQDCNFVATNREGKAIYAAIESKRRPGMVFGMVFLVDARNGEVGYKDMDESMGPFYYGASKRVLDALTPTTDETALKWREQCRAKLAAPKFKLTEGLHVKFDPPLKFNTGEHIAEFIVDDARKRTFIAVGGAYYSRYKIDLSTIKRNMESGNLTVVS